MMNDNQGLPFPLGSLVRRKTSPILSRRKKGVPTSVQQTAHVWITSQSLEPVKITGSKALKFSQPVVFLGEFKGKGFSSFCFLLPGGEIGLLSAGDNISEMFEVVTDNENAIS